MGENIKVIKLQSYLDKCFISGILCDYHYQFYYKLSMGVMLPTVIGSAILTVLNTSDIPTDVMKYINIIVNGSNTLIMALTNNYKLQDRLTTYKNLYGKYQSLSHRIESCINNSNEITDKVLDDFINEYDVLQNDNSFGYLSGYKTKIIKAYGKTKSLPNSLALEQDMIKADVINIV